MEQGSVQKVHHLKASTDESVDEISGELESLKYQLASLKQKVQRRSEQHRSAEPVRAVIAARARRNQHFDPLLFADPAWDILLELYASSLEQRRVSVSKVCGSAAVPATTALRWICKMENDGLVLREPDPFDRRRIWISLSPIAMRSMDNYFGTSPSEELSL